MSENSATLIGPNSKNPIQISFEKFTPEQAAHILENHNYENQRPLRERVAQSYAEQMRSKDLWKVESCQPIRFNAEGMLLDGQHRLRGIVLSGLKRGVDMMVCRGIHESNLCCIDDGARKSLTDALKMANPTGWGYRITSVAASVGHLQTLKYASDNTITVNNVRSVKKFSTTESVKFFESLPSFKRDFVSFLNKFDKKELAVVMPVASAFALYYLFSRVDKEMSYRLMMTLQTGVPFEGGAEDPMFAVRNMLINCRINRSTLRIEDHMNAWIWAFQETKAGNTHKNYRPNQRFIIGHDHDGAEIVNAFLEKLA